MPEDAFALLGLDRRAGLSAAEVRQAFQQAAAAAHPDGAEDETAREERTARFQKINEASAVLTPVAARLKHLLELEFPDFQPPRQTVMDEALVVLFTLTGEAVQAAADWVRKRQAATSFLAKAALTASEMTVQEKLEAAGQALRDAQDQLAASLAELDGAAAGRPGLLSPETLNALARRAAFLEKWQAQVQAAWASLFAVES